MNAATIRMTVENIQNVLIPLEAIDVIVFRDLTWSEEHAEVEHSSLDNAYFYFLSMVFNGNNFSSLFLNERLTNLNLIVKILF